MAYLKGFVHAVELARKSAAVNEPAKPVETKEPNKPVEVKEPNKPAEPVKPKETKPKKTSFAALASNMPSDAPQPGQVVEVKASQLGAFLNRKTFENAKKSSMPANKIGQMIEFYGGLDAFLLATTDRIPGHLHNVDPTGKGFWCKGTVLVRTGTGELIMLETYDRSISSFVETTTKYVPKGENFKLSASLTDPQFFMGLTAKPCQDGPETPFVWALNKNGIPFNWRTVSVERTISKDGKLQKVPCTYYVMPSPKSKAFDNQELSKYAVYQDGADWRVVQFDAGKKEYIGCTIGAVYNAMYRNLPEAILAKMNPVLTGAALEFVKARIFDAYQDGLRDAQKVLANFKPDQDDQSDAGSHLSEGWEPAK